MSLATKIAKNLTSMSAMRVGSAGLSFILFWVLARGAGSEFLGTYAFLLGVFAFVQQLPLLGLHLAAVRDVAASSETTPAVMTNLGSVGLLSASLMGLALALTGCYFYPGNMHSGFILVALSLLPTAWVNISEAALIGQQRMSMIAGVNLMESVLRVILSLLVIEAGYGLTGLFATFLFFRMAAALAYLSWGGLPRWQRHLLDFQAIRQNLRECPVYLAIMVFSAAISRFDVFFLSRLGSFSDVGIYSVASKIYEVALMAPSVITSVLYPAFSQIAERDRPKLGEILNISFFWMFLLSVPCAIAVGLMAEPVIVAIFGSQYASSAVVLQILIASVVLVALNQTFTLALLASHGQTKDLKVLLIATLCHIVFLSVLIPQMGFVGAAWATLLTMAIQLLARIAYVRSWLGLKPDLMGLARPALAGAAMIAAAYLVGRDLPVLGMLLGAAVYVVIVVVSGAVSRQTIANVLTMLMARKKAVAP